MQVSAGRQDVAARIRKDVRTALEQEGKGKGQKKSDPKA